MDTGSPLGQRARLASLRRRRAELRDTMNALEKALAAAVTDGEVAWTRHAHASLVALADDFAIHVEITEGPEGLYAEVLQYAPRLSGAVARLTEEHGEISRALEQALAAASQGREGGVEVVRSLGTSLLGRLVRHRQRGSDLVYEAYEVDIGGDT